MGKIDITKAFSHLTSKQWKQQIQYDLKGADYNETLLWESPDGIKVKPFYSSEDLESQGPLPPIPNVWKIGQLIEAQDASLANGKAMHALENGVEALQFKVPTAKMEPQTLLKGINLKQTAVHFHFEFLSPDYVQSIFDQSPEAPAGIFLHLDPIGRLTSTGNWYDSQKADLEAIKKIHVNGRRTTGINFTGVNTGVYHNAGATTVQQLGYAMAHAHEYIHLLGDEIQGPPAFTVAVGPNYFFEIAKIRALRLLWKTLALEYGLPIDCHLMATPGLRNKTLYDFNVNMLRTTSECMSAILGNADTVINQRYDALFKEPNDFGERMARNQLLLLKHEAHFNEVSNPADGAYFIETLTLQLAEKALSLFKQLEAGGGFLKQLREHTIQKKIRESAGKEQELFEQGKLILVGTNAHQHKNERVKGQIDRLPITKNKGLKTLIEPVPVRRLAADLEQERLGNE